MISEKNFHFFSFRVNPASYDGRKMWRTSVLCSYGVLKKMTISSRYTRAHCHLADVRVTSIARWNVTGAFFTPNDIRTKRYSSWCDVNAVFLGYGPLFQFSNMHCWHPELKILLLLQGYRCTGPCKVADKSRVFWLRLIFYSLHRIGGSRPLPAQRLLVTTSLWWGSITFSANIQSISTAVNVRASGPAQYGAEWTGETSLLVRSMLCFATFIRTKWPSHIVSNSASIWMNVS